MKKKVVVIGGGFSGLSASSYLAKKGYDVTIIEKNKEVGGRARRLTKGGFSFDMGPSWYWMPEVFEGFFKDFGHKSSDFYKLKRLDPSYRVFFKDSIIDLPASINDVYKTFEKLEIGSGKKLKVFLEKNKIVYDIAMKKFVPLSYTSLISFISWDTFVNGIRIFKQYNVFKPVSSLIESNFHDPKLIKILKFPTYFLGASAEDLPSIYAIMNHVDMDLGTWHPEGGFGKVVEAFVNVAIENSVKIKTGEEVVKIVTENNLAKLVVTKKNRYTADIVVSTADYHHTESRLLKVSERSYSEGYWQKKSLAPSAFMVFLGLNKRIQGLLHHNLFFHNSWEDHNNATFKLKKWPENPLYYINVPSKTDTTFASGKGEAITILIPIASGMKDTKKLRSYYYNWVINDLEKRLNFQIRPSIVLSNIYSTNDFMSDYNSYKGNAYGLGHIASQTAVFRPKVRSKKIKNLFFAGHMTLPGIGVPMAVISGKIAANDIVKYYE